MNAHFLMTGEAAKAASAKERHKRTGKPPAGLVDDVAKLPVWQRTSTTLGAKHVYPTGGAILAVCEVPDKDLPYVKDWRPSLKEIDWQKRGFVYQFLRNVIFWHHRSTSGRFNDALGRFERWGVWPAEEWNNITYDVLNPNPSKDMAGYDKHIAKRVACLRQFHVHKDRLIDMGLIEAESHLSQDMEQSYKAMLAAQGLVKATSAPLITTALWIKPTEELSRIVFEPGYWQTVRTKHAYVRPKRKPRGVHVKVQLPALAIEANS